MLGRELVPLFLKNTDYDIYLFVHLQGKELNKKALLRKLFRLSSKLFEEKLHVLTGDITKKNLGLSKKDAAELNKVITDIIHAAAITRFDLDIDSIRKINVEGTKNVLEFAEHCVNLKQLAFISTPYTSGKRTGKIFENDRVHNSGFVNTYEQSKYEGEALVESASDKLPTVIYRISTIIGDSKTGKVTHFTAPHLSLRIMYLGLAAMVPGTPDYSIDLVPSDYAAKTIFALYTRHFKSKQVFHIVGGLKKSYKLQELIDETYECLSKLDPEWEKRQYPKPVISSIETFNLFIKSVEQANNPLFLSVIGALKSFAYQLNYPKEFDTTNLLNYIPQYEEELPDIRQYYPKVVEYCLRSNWGHKQV